MAGNGCTAHLNHLLRVLCAVRVMEHLHTRYTGGMHHCCVPVRPGRSQPVNSRGVTWSTQACVSGATYSLNWLALVTCSIEARDFSAMQISSERCECRTFPGRGTARVPTNFPLLRLAAVRAHRPPRSTMHRRDTTHLERDSHNVSIEAPLQRFKGPEHFSQQRLRP